MYLAGRGCYEAGELAGAKKYIARPWPRALGGETHRQIVPGPPNNRRQLRGPGRRRDGGRRGAALGEAGGIIAAGRCAVPGGKGEGSCKDLPSPGPARRAGRAGYAAPSSARRPCRLRNAPRGLLLGERAPGIFSLACRAASFPPPAPSPRAKPPLLPLQDGSVRMAGGARGARLCRCRFTAWMRPLQRRASVSLPATQQERCSITLAKHPGRFACKNVPIITHPTLPSLARENSDMFYPLV